MPMARSTLEKIADREQVVTAHAEQIREQIDQLTACLREREQELDDLATARKVIVELADEDCGPTLPDNPAYQQILAALTDATRPLRARDLCQTLDVGIEPKHVEGMRCKLKRLVGRGLVAEDEPGLFVLHRQ
jgi:hypothetical protein